MKLYLIQIKQEILNYFKNESKVSNILSICVSVILGTMLFIKSWFILGLLVLFCSLLVMNNNNINQLKLRMAMFDMFQKKKDLINPNKKRFFQK